MHVFQLTIGRGDCSNDYSHVHHADAIRFLEQGRLRCLEEGGQPNDAFLQRGLFLVVSHLSVNYLRELVPGTYLVETKALECLPKVLQLSQEIRNEKGKLAVSAEVHIMCLDGKKKRAVLLPDELLGLF